MHDYRELYAGLSSVQNAAGIMWHEWERIFRCHWHGWQKVKEALPSKRVTTRNNKLECFVLPRVKSTGSWKVTVNERSMGGRSHDTDWFWSGSLLWLTIPIHSIDLSCNSAARARQCHRDWWKFLWLYALQSAHVQYCTESASIVLIYCH